MELLRQAVGVRRAWLQRSSFLLRYEQSGLRRQSGYVGRGFHTVVSRLYVLQFSRQVRLLGDERIDAASSRDRNLSFGLARPVPRKRTQAAGYFAHEGNKVYGTA